jgi:hypothetical protein
MSCRVELVSRRERFRDDQQTHEHGTKPRSNRGSSAHA